MRRFSALVLFVTLAAPSEARDSAWIPVRGIDLLALIDLKKDRVRGEWTLEQSVLTCTRKMTAARVVIPYIPPEEYTLVIVAERTEGSDALVTGLASGDHQFVHCADGYTVDSLVVSSFEMLDNKIGRENESRRDGQVFVNARPSTLRYLVRKGNIGFAADGKEILDWKGDFKRLSVRPDYRVSYPGVLFIGAWMSQFRISKMTLYPRSVGGRLLRDKPK